MFKLQKKFNKLIEANLPSVKKIALKYGHETIIKLNYNENKFGASPKIYEILKIANPHIYPEYENTLVIAKLAKLYNLPINQFYISNGSDAILDAIPTLFITSADSNIIIPKITYKRMAIAAEVKGINVKFIDLINDKINLNKILEKIDEKTEIIYLVNPNMPHGTLISHEDIITFMNKISDQILVVIDEAYAEYANGITENFILNKELISKFDNLIITHTFSKLFGLASFRIGYMISSKKIVDLFKKSTPYLPVSTLSLQAADIALDDLKFYETIVIKTKVELMRVSHEFRTMGISFVPSFANYIFIKIDNPKKVREFILKEKGVMIRQVKNHGLRMTIGKNKENTLALDGFRSYLGKHGQS